MAFHTFARNESHVVLCKTEAQAWRRMCSAAFSRRVTWESVCLATDAIEQAAKQDALAHCSLSWMLPTRQAMRQYPRVDLAHACEAALPTVSV